MLSQANKLHQNTNIASMSPTFPSHNPHSRRANRITEEMGLTESPSPATSWDSDCSLHTHSWRIERWARRPSSRDASWTPRPGWPASWTPRGSDPPRPRSGSRPALLEWPDTGLPFERPAQATVSAPGMARYGVTIPAASPGHSQDDGQCSWNGEKQH